MTAPSKRRWTFVHLGLLLVPAAAVALVLWVGRAPREEPAQVLAALREQAAPFLPSGAATGAASVTLPERYGRDRLHELVNGAAERLLEQGCERAAAAIYGFSEHGGLEIAAEAYRFRDEAGAWQAAADRPVAAVPVSQAPGVFTDGQVLHAVQGRQLLKLTVLSTAPGASERMVDLAAAWRREQP